MNDGPCAPHLLEAHALREAEDDDLSAVEAEREESSLRAALRSRDGGGVWSVAFQTRREEHAQLVG
jgi:hypothetical protein